MQSLDVAELDPKIDPARFLATGAFGDLADGARSVATYSRGLTKGFLLNDSVAAHAYLHFGETAAIRSMLRHADYIPA